jgi:hypothetical protein
MLNNSIERSAKICEPLDIEVKKPIICGRLFFSETAWPCELKLYMKPGVDPETLLTGGFSYGTIFSIVFIEDLP